MSKANERELIDHYTATPPEGILEGDLQILQISDQQAPPTGTADTLTYSATVGQAGRVYAYLAANEPDEARRTQVLTLSYDKLLLSRTTLYKLLANDQILDEQTKTQSLQLIWAYDQDLYAVETALGRTPQVLPIPPGLFGQQEAP
ncbi:hypothetical protein [Mycobacteroides abscessus]